jgi:hypothetical protein
VVLVGVIGAVASIIAIPLAIYLYRRGNKRRGLAYKVHPVRTQIVKAGTASRLSVVHDDREIKTDITAVHLAIWNEGRESIRQGDMLRPLIIQTEDHVAILEASIRMATRDVIGLRLDESACMLGQLGVSWDILENDDGGIVQIIYAGSPELQITMYGIPEGQRQGIMSINRIIPPVPGLEKAIYAVLFLELAYALTGGWTEVAQFFQIAPFAEKYPVVEGWARWLHGLAIALLVPTVVLILLTFSKLRQLKPPFEF